MFEINLGPVQPGMSAQPIFNSVRWRHMAAFAQHWIQRGEDGTARALETLRPCLQANDPFHVHATLRKDEWIMLDEIVDQTNRETLSGVVDLTSRGLRINIPNPFATTVLEAEKVGEVTEADVTMYASTPPSEDRAEFDLWGVPVPIISKAFRIDERPLQASRMKGQTLDITNAELKTRAVAEKLEDLLFNGWAPTYSSYTLYGYTTHPNRNLGSLSGSWATLAATNPKAIKDDVIAMKQAGSNDFAMGPYILYVPLAWNDHLDNDYFSYVAASPAAATGLTSPTMSIRGKLLEMADIEAIRPTTRLTDEEVLVSMRRNVIDVGFGFEPRLIQWQEEGGMLNRFRVISIMTFRVKSDASNRSGVMHYSV